MANIIYKINQGETDYNIASSAYCTCSTAAGTAAKVAYLQGSSSNSFVLSTGITIFVKFTNTNTASSPTLNVNGTGAKPIVNYGNVGVGKTTNNSWWAGAVVGLTYDGTSWVIVSGGIDSDTYPGIMSANGVGLGKPIAWYYRSTATMGGQAWGGSTSPVDAGEVKTIDICSRTATTGRYYGIESDQEGRLFVNVPWESSSYTLPTASSSTKGGIKVGTGLSMSSETMSVSYGTSATTAAVGNDSRFGKITLNKITYVPEVPSRQYYKIALASSNTASVDTNPTATSTTMSYLPEWALCDNGIMYGDSIRLTGSLMLNNDTIYMSADQIGGAVNLKIENGYHIQTNKIYAPTSSNGTTYGYGSSGQVLKSNGTTVYWASDNTGTDNDKKTSSSNSTSKLYLVGATSQSTAGQTTYSNVGCYTQSGVLYSGSKRVVIGDTSGSNTPYNIVTITEANYNALSTKNANTLYIIV